MSKSWRNDSLSSIKIGLRDTLSCGIQTINGNFLTAVGGGGRITDVVHTDARSIGSWEKFTLVQSGNTVGLQTANGRYLTAVGGGGQITDVLHTDATGVGAWEQFRLVCD